MKKARSKNDDNEISLSPFSASKEEFTNKYRENYFNTPRAEKLYMMALQGIKKSVTGGNLSNLKNLNRFMDYIKESENQEQLSAFYVNTNNPLKSTNLVILACKHNSLEILNYLFDESNILKHLSVDCGLSGLKPFDEDEECHNAFYYAIRSVNTKLLETLITKFPGKYFDLNPNELDEIISQTYEDLNLKNIRLSNQMVFFIESQLINLRFSSNNKIRFEKQNMNHVLDRIQLLLDNINLLKQIFSNEDKLDEKFLYVAKCVIKNLHILKRQLKSTYCRLPWEEIEFFLTSFVLTVSEISEINLFCHVTLDRSKVSNHLELFANELAKEKVIIESGNASKLKDLPKLSREEIVAQILIANPEFEEFYRDYQKLKDIYTLKKLNEFIDIAVSTDSRSQEGQLVIKRTLQVLGEYLKNSLESPNLSTVTTAKLLLVLPKNTRKIITDLRNSLSHFRSLSNQESIEENEIIKFYFRIQNDIKRVGDVINSILQDNKTQVISMLLTKITLTNNLNEIKNFSSSNYVTTNHQKLQDLVGQLKEIIPDITAKEQEMINNITAILKCNEERSRDANFKYITKFEMLRSLGMILNANRMNEQDVKGIKLRCGKLLEGFEHDQPQTFREIGNRAIEIIKSLKRRIADEKFEDICRIAYEIVFVSTFETDEVKSIEELREKLSNKNHAKTTDHYSKEQRDKSESQLTLKISQLKTILATTSVDEQYFNDFKNNKKLRTAVEMLILDILSLMDYTKTCFASNSLFLDDYTPLLTGKCLRNHLAHDNFITDILSSDPAMALLLNARKFALENFKNKRKLGKQIKEDPIKLQQKQKRGLIAIANQQKLFRALQEGDFEDLHLCLERGADINARDMSLWSALHFAAKGQSTEMIHFVIDQGVDLNSRNIDGNSPLHIAAKYGRSRNVQLFVDKLKISVNIRGDQKKAPLHYAAEHGHKETVLVLLRNKSDTHLVDFAGVTPLGYAITNYHNDVAKILSEQDKHVDANKALGIYTPLHDATEGGNLELVNYLLQNKANVNAADDRNWTCLHAASYRGYFEIVNSLILHGANVNARVVNGCTPLHYACEMGHHEIVALLVKKGANVNAIDKSYCNTPMHNAVNYGHKEIVNFLLQHGAKADEIATANTRPLHLAAKNGYIEIVISLLQHGVDLHSRDMNKATALHHAVQGGHIDIATLLLRNGAEIMSRDTQNRTPLHVAAFGDNKEILECLLVNGAVINARDSESHTPLHTAILKGNDDFVNIFLKNKADLSARIKNNLTPLHLTANMGCSTVAEILLKNGADINAKGEHGLTTLHGAVVGNQKNLVHFLIKNGANIEAKETNGFTPLMLAIELGLADVTDILLDNGANVNVKSNGLTPLILAIKYNYNEIVTRLLDKGANVNFGQGMPLAAATLAGFTRIVSVLLENKAYTDVKLEENNTLMHLAVSRGHTDIVKVFIRKGFCVNSSNSKGLTPLHQAAEMGFDEVVEALIAAGANINSKEEGNIVPLHCASVKGHIEVVKLLLKNKVNIKQRDDEGRTSLELAVSYNHLEIVKMLLDYEKTDVNAKGNDDYTILHIASQGTSLNMVEYLVGKGCNINAKNLSGSKVIHIAAREGFLEAVEYFLRKGLSIEEPGHCNQTPLHYATLNNNLKVVKFLLAKGADVNAKDTQGLSPLFLAAHFGHEKIIDTLLKNNAYYDIVENHHVKPIEVASNKDVISLLFSIEKLFVAVRNNRLSDIRILLKEGAFPDATDSDNAKPLHYAALEGFTDVVDILLKNKANPNVAKKNGWTPLHYAAKFSHYNIVKLLLSYGAVYNPVSNRGKTPVDFTDDKRIVELIKVVDDSFQNVQKGNTRFIKDYNNSKVSDILKVIMNARNSDNKTLVVVAMESDFPQVKQLKELGQGNIAGEVQGALRLVQEEQFGKALKIAKNAFEKRKNILGLDNPGTLDIQIIIAEILLSQGEYKQALDTYNDIVQRQQGIFGEHHIATLSARSQIALILHRIGKNEEALNIYQEIYPIQKKILGQNHSDTSGTQVHLALVLDGLGRYDEALEINKEVFQRHKKTFGLNHPFTITAQNNIAMVLAHQEKHEEALKLYEEVFERKKLIFGKNHANTMKTFSIIANLRFHLKRDSETLNALEEIATKQTKKLGPNHPDTLTTRQIMAESYLEQARSVPALKELNKCFEGIKALYGPSNPDVINISKRLESLHHISKIEGRDFSQVLEHLQTDINCAASKGDIQTIQDLLDKGTDVNATDVDGRTPLHFAVAYGDANTVNVLLKNGADVTLATNKGNTALHIATAKGYEKIVEMLLHQTDHAKLITFVNAKTTKAGTTALHIAAQSGFFNIAKVLLNQGAMYDVQNRDGKVPLDLSTDQDITHLLETLKDLFLDAWSGKAGLVNKVRLHKGDVKILTNSRDSVGNTLLQVVIMGRHKEIATGLLRIIQETNQIMEMLL